MQCSSRSMWLGRGGGDTTLKIQYIVNVSVIRVDIMIVQIYRLNQRSDEE